MREKSKPTKPTPIYTSEDVARLDAGLPPVVRDTHGFRLDTGMRADATATPMTPGPADFEGPTVREMLGLGDADPDPSTIGENQRGECTVPCATDGSWFNFRREIPPHVYGEDAVFDDAIKAIIAGRDLDAKRGEADHRALTHAEVAASDAGYTREPDGMAAWHLACLIRTEIPADLDTPEANRVRQAQADLNAAALSRLNGDAAWREKWYALDLPGLSIPAAPTPAEARAALVHVMAGSECYDTTNVPEIALLPRWVACNPSRLTPRILMDTPDTPAIVPSLKDRAAAVLSDGDLALHIHRAIKAGHVRFATPWKLEGTARYVRNDAITGQQLAELSRTVIGQLGRSPTAPRAPDLYRVRVAGFDDPADMELDAGKAWVAARFAARDIRDA